MRLISAILAIAALSTSVISVPTPLDTPRSEDTAQSDDCTPSLYGCGEYIGGPPSQFIIVCNSQSTWVTSADCGCAGGCQLSGTIFLDSHDVYEASTAFCECSKDDDSSNSASSARDTLTDHSLDVVVRDTGASNPTTDFTSLEQMPQGSCVPTLYSCDSGGININVCNSLGQWALSSDCGCFYCCHLSGNQFTDSQGQIEATGAYCSSSKVSRVAETVVRNTLAKDTATERGIARTTLDQRSEDLTSNDGCEPGTEKCSNDDSQVLACDDNSFWKTTLFCGDGNHCMYSAGGMPFCISNETSGEFIATSLDKREATAGCVPGTYSCDIMDSQIFVCDGQYWELIAECGGAGSCEYGANGVPYCH
ncbi:hypothetical protein AOQ84DRAFT_405944 [Glonium stellatum]|uniref:Uncharacterized protein n=1 Tax=Glonium stellatum TaxID=574774 RepID=A0A8E2F1E2_9PEZI|nr:hypothetical protein AOQ84DRAFT_405944 [Glonium stellatum]